VGDCNGRGAFTHTSWNDHEIVVANLFDNDPRRISDRIACYALFIDPALGRVGMTETEALASGRACCARRCRCSASAAPARPARRRAS
jgi:pyruvate/2-oxoglutarate dehydrogenase complex dihydrolipoamide dehydrogenase (E3) component